MMLRSLLFAATLCAAAPMSHAGEELLSEPAWDPAVCNKKNYPKAALLDDQEGAVAVAVLVNADGKPAETRLLLSSGSRELDRATQQIYLNCRYTPGQVAGKPTAMWQHITYVWRIEPNNGQLVEGLAQAALAGNAGARYKLAHILRNRAASEADWREAVELLIGAAEQGEPMAQVALGAIYESGKLASGRNMDEARRWYELAAARGNVYAIDHLRFIRDMR